MKRISILFRRHRENLFRFFLFIITVAILVFLLPTERKFGFEYRKGAPWMHEDLIAPFDFAIQKNPDVIEKQKDSIQQRANVFYRFRDEAFMQLDSTFNQSTEKAFNRFVDTTNLTSNQKNDLNFYLDSLRLVYSDIMHKGVIDTVLIHEGAPDKDITLLRNNVAHTFEEILPLPEKAAALLRKKINSFNLEQEKLRAFFTKLNVGQYVKPTAVYDKQTTADNLESLTKSLSTTSGMIQRGQRIISRGELITSDTYQIIESLRMEYESTQGIGRVKDWLIAGKIIVISLAIGVLFLFLIYFRREVLQHRVKSYFIVFLLLLMVLAAGITSNADNINIYVVPIAIMPIIIQIFYDPRLAIFVHMVTIVIIGFIVPNPFKFVFIQFVVGVVAILSLRNMHRRQQIFFAALAVFTTYSLVYLGLGMMQEGDITKIDPMQFAWFAGNSMLVLWTYPLIYLFEKMFGFLSDVTLMEMADTNHPLLRKLNEKAPGTFQHSMQVANLAEAVVRRIGGNPSLVRTGALYHDIGKMKNPEYFIENQVPNRNPHDKHTFEESANIIINHVKDGIKMARQYNLPKPVVDFIRTHHGDGLVQYFYRSHVNQFPEEIVDESRFRYPGPTPFSKETGVVMMADSVEAASRSLKTMNEETIDNLVDNIISYIINENQLDDADITFKDINIAKSIFKEKLKNIYHARIEYPAENNNTNNQKS
ncbi:phosphodiesterase [Salinivirga cyanobacteriivorans]|uniref:Phosphodiesterase n=1 Tax=Salinivirga cyanobacteriivorans TaxID=1307839 RepID=A0A0S2I504_9BACT|nr:HDIG domain-containing metalloprotein [Salinivirga cyanobacteriivorans]ALO17322.1 phosphodiesterase [Salinivirga cyanobacteriivorans]